MRKPNGVMGEGRVPGRLSAFHHLLKRTENLTPRHMHIRMYKSLFMG